MQDPSQIQGLPEQHESPLPPTLKFDYSDFKLIAETKVYYLYEAKSLHAPNPIHTIKVFNSTSQFSKENYDMAVTLFMKELLYLMTIDPKLVIVNSFVVSNKGKRMAFASLPYTPLSYELKQKRELAAAEEQKNDELKPLPPFDEIEGVKDIIADLLLDVEFLYKELRSTECSKILVPESIYKIEESGAYFLGDWATALTSNEDQNFQSTVPFSKTDSSLEVFEEMLNLGVSLLELNGVEEKKILRIRKMIQYKDEFLDSILQNVLNEIPKELKQLLERMLNKNVNLRPELNELNKHEGKRKKKPKVEFKINLESLKLKNDELDFLVQKVMENWTNITELSLRENGIDSKGVEILSKNVSWINLASLDLKSNYIGDGGAIALSKNVSWINLTSLILHSNNIYDEGVIGLSMNESWINLKSLDLSYNNISDEGAVTLSKNVTWINLTSLNLQSNNIGNEGVTALSMNVSWINLTSLDLSYNSIKDDGATALGKNVSWINLTSLILHSNNIYDEGVIGLSMNVSWINLTSLNLHANYFGEKGGIELNKRWPNIRFKY